MRTSSNPPPSPTEVISEANQAISELVFEPTDAQRRLKVRFWAAMNDVPNIDKPSIGPDFIKKYTGTSPIVRWWQDQSFKEWFLNVDEQRQKLEYLFDLALDAARDIITNDDPKAQSARVQMIKSIAELANKMPQRNLQQKSGIAGALETMDKAELAMFLEKNGVKLEINASKNQPLKIKDSQTVDIDNND